MEAFNFPGEIAVQVSFYQSWYSVPHSRVIIALYGIGLLSSSPTDYTKVDLFNFGRNIVICHINKSLFLPLKWLKSIISWVCHKYKQMM